MQVRQPIEIAVCGAGLAAQMTAAALAHQLAGSARVTVIEDGGAEHDVFYGSTTAPSAYAFNLSCGVSEPRVLLGTNAAFCWGTRYESWGADALSWIQCFHLPLPIDRGVVFHHYLLKLGIHELEPFLVSAVAARRGVFAHPLEKAAKLLARAEYGYQIDASSYLAPFTAAAAKRVRVVRAGVSDVECHAEGIAALRLSDGQTLRADLYVDCTGPGALLLSRLGSRPQGRPLCALTGRTPVDGVRAPCRTLAGHDFGWQSDTSLQGSVARMTVFHPESEAKALAAHGATPDRRVEVTLGRRDAAWLGNCVGIGQAVDVLEPLTHAPLLMLQRDIERLLTLIPLDSQMSVERREFNRQFTEDHAHAELFTRALFAVRGLDSPYWCAACEGALPEKLDRKIRLFESRGALAAFDLEPFNAEDWTILHFGLGRRPARHDRVADRVPEAEIRQGIERLRGEIQGVVAKLPPHNDYMTGLVRHLRQGSW